MLHHTEIQYWCTSVSRFLPLILMKKDMCAHDAFARPHVAPRQRPAGQYVSPIIESDRVSVSLQLDVG